MTQQRPSGSDPEPAGPDPWAPGPPQPGPGPAAAIPGWAPVPQPAGYGQPPPAYPQSPHGYPPQQFGHVSQPFGQPAQQWYPQPQFGFVRPKPPNVFRPESGPAAGTWTMLDVLAGLGLLMVASLVLSLPFQLWPAPHFVVILVAGFLPVWLALATQARWSIRNRGSGSWRADLGLQFRWVDLAIGFGLGIGGRIFAGVVALLTTDPSDRGRGNLDVIVGGLQGPELWLVLVVGGTIIAPIIEELFFRGLLIRSATATLLRRRPGWTPGRRNFVVICLSGLLFTAVHLSEVSDRSSAPTLLITLTAFGAANAAVTIATGRLGSAVVGHLVFNGTATLALWALR